MHYIKPLRVHLVLTALTLALIFASFIPARHAQAAAGDLDPTFGNGGKVKIQLGRNSGAQAVKVQSNGKVVIAGSVLVFNAVSHLFNSDFLIMRFEANGALDASFGIDGVVTTDLSGREADDFAAGLLIQPDGKIVAAGQVSGDFGLARYNSDGSLDSTFGSGGKVLTDFSNQVDSATSIALQADGKIIAGGVANSFSTDNDFALARYNPDGSLDTTFGVGGKVVTDFSAKQDAISSVIIQPDGKIVAVGDATIGPSGQDNVHFALARYSTNGSLDSTFGSGGKLTTDFGTSDPHFSLGDEAHGAALQADGKIVATGEALNAAGGFDFATARYNSDGSLDSTFGSGGKVLTNFPSNIGTATSVAIQGDNRIVVGGSAINPAVDQDFALVRYNPNGTLDSGFGFGGKLYTDFGGSDDARAMVLQSDGKIILAGFSQTSENDVVLARYSNNVTPNFDICLQDDSNHNLLQFNSVTGAYQFTNCGGISIGGTGTVTRLGNLITLQHNIGDRRVTARIDLGTHRATAAVQLLATGRSFTITDRNTTDDTCSCK